MNMSKLTVTYSFGRIPGLIMPTPLELAASHLEYVSVLVYQSPWEKKRLRWCVPSSPFRVPLNAKVVHTLMTGEGLQEEDSFGQTVAGEIQQMWNAVNANIQPSTNFSSATSVDLPPYFEQVTERQVFVSFLAAADRDTTPALWQLGFALAKVSKGKNKFVTENILVSRYLSEFPSVQQFMQASAIPEARKFAEQMMIETPGLETFGNPFLGEMTLRLHPSQCDTETAVRQDFTVPHLFNKSVSNLYKFPPKEDSYPPLIAFRAGLDGNLGLSPLAPVYQLQETDARKARLINEAVEPVLEIMVSSRGGSDKTFAHPEREIDDHMLMMFQNTLNNPVDGRSEAIALLTNLSQNDWNEIVHHTRQALYCPTSYYDRTPGYSSYSFFVNHALPFLCGNADRSVIIESGIAKKSQFGAENLLGDYPLSQIERVAFDWLPEAIARLPERARTQLMQTYREIFENKSFGSCIRFWADNEKNRVTESGRRMAFADESLSTWQTIMDLHPADAYEFMQLWQQVEWIYNAAYLAFKLKERDIPLAQIANNGLQFSAEKIYDQVLTLEAIQRNKENPRPVSLTLTPHEYFVFVGGNGTGKTVTNRTLGQIPINAGTQNPIFGARAVVPPDTISFVLADEGEHVRDDEGLSFFGKELQRMSLFFAQAEQDPDKPLFLNLDEIHQSTDTLEGTAIFGAYLRYLEEKSPNRPIYLTASSHSQYASELQEVLQQYGIKVKLATIDPETKEIIEGKGDSRGALLLIKEKKYGDDFCHLLERLNAGETALVAQDFQNLKLPESSKTTHTSWQKRTGEALGILRDGKMNSYIDNLLRVNKNYFAEIAFSATAEQAKTQRDFMQKVWRDQTYRETAERFLDRVGNLSTLAAYLTMEPHLEPDHREKAHQELLTELNTVRQDLNVLEAVVDQETNQTDNQSGLSLKTLYQLIEQIDKKRESMKEFARASILMRGICNISQAAPKNRFCLVEELEDDESYFLEAKGIWTTSLLNDKKPEEIVTNDLEFMEDEDICGVVGSNTGGKTRFGTRAVPEIAYMAYHLGIGPGEKIKMKIPEYIGLILKRNKYVDRGRWQRETDTALEELQDWDKAGRPKRTLWAYDEIGSSTSSTDASNFAKILFGLLSAHGAKIIFTTHFHELPQALRETLGRNVFVLGTDYFAEGERYKFKRVTDAPSMAIRIAEEDQYQIPKRIIEFAQEILMQLKVLSKKNIKE